MEKHDVIIVLLIIVIVMIWFCRCKCGKGCGSMKEGWIAGEDATLEPCYTQCMAAAKANYPNWMGSPVNYSNYVTDPICRQACCKRCNNNP